MNADPQLENLMTYTVFHIGVYVTLVAALVGVGLSKQLAARSVLIVWLRYSTAFLTLAGICGGVIGSNIPNFTSYDKLLKTKIGFWSLPILPGNCWIHAEHAAFWLGLLPVAAWFIIRGPKGF